MAIHCDWVTACSTALVDRLTNHVSLINVVEVVQVARLPAVVPPFHVVAVWRNGTDMSVAVRLRIDVVEQGGETLSALSEEDVTFSGRLGHRSICIVHAMSVPRPGAYRIVARHRSSEGTWVEGASHPFQVTAAPAQAVQA